MLPIRILDGEEIRQWGLIIVTISLYWFNFGFRWVSIKTQTLLICQSNTLSPATPKRAVSRLFSALHDDQSDLAVRVILTSTTRLSGRRYQTVLTANDRLHYGPVNREVKGERTRGRGLRDRGRNDLARRPWLTTRAGKTRPSLSSPNGILL